MEASDNKNNSIDFLWEKFRQGDYSVLEDLFKDLYKEIYYYGLKLFPVQEIVKDTIQDVFADIWVRREKMYVVDKIKPYLFISVRHELLKQEEKQRKKSSLKNYTVRSFELSKEDFMMREEAELAASQTLVQCLQRLTDRQREVILLRFNHELKFEEIARIMNMNVQSVRNLLVRALESIRRDKNAPGMMGSNNVEIFLLHIFSKNKIIYQHQRHETFDFSFLIPGNPEYNRIGSQGPECKDFQ
jgi:RNA polymerase sigma factor (sigma-70 family)